MKVAVIFLLFLLITGCGIRKEVKIPSQEYTYTTQAFQVVNELRQAYQNRDNLSMRKNCSESGYREIVASMKPFDKAELEFTPVFAEMEDGVLKLYVSWNGKWSYIDKETEERGLAIFLIRGNPPKIEKIIRGSPFRYPD